MKIAICCYSSHHGNTRKVAQAMAREIGAELLDATARQDVCLEDCDCVGLASGLYFGKFQAGVLRFARQYLPEGKPVFFVSTCGMLRPGYTGAVERIAREKGCPVLGRFSCPGYDTFGPFRLVGGIAKGRPDSQDLERARSFYSALQKTYDRGTET